MEAIRKESGGRVRLLGHKGTHDYDEGKSFITLFSVKNWSTFSKGVNPRPVKPPKGGSHSIITIDFPLQSELLSVGQKPVA